VRFMISLFLIELFANLLTYFKSFLGNFYSLSVSKLICFYITSNSGGNRLCDITFENVIITESVMITFSKLISQSLFPPLFEVI